MRFGQRYPSDSTIAWSCRCFNHDDLYACEQARRERGGESAGSVVSIEDWRLLIEDWKKECGNLELRTHPISGEIGYGGGEDSHKKHKGTQKVRLGSPMLCLEHFFFCGFL
jgi:hypothetical protein